MKKTVIYVRRSLNENMQKTSIDYQISACKEYAINQGFIVHQIFNEGGRSARGTELEERECITKLMDEIRGGIIERIIVFKRDRIARNANQYMEFVELIRKYNVSVHFSCDNEPQMFDGVIGDFIELLFGGISEHEGNNIIKRQEQSKLAKLHNGELPNGRKSAFYTDKPVENGKKKLWINEENRKKLNKVYQIVSETKVKTIKECNKLVRDELSDKSLDVRKIIPKQIHKGWITAKFKGKMERSNKCNNDLRVVSDELWKKANEVYENFSDYVSDSEKDMVKPLLQNVLFCKTCKNKLVCKSGNYYCGVKPNGAKRSVLKFDEKILALVQKELKDYVKENKTEIIRFFTENLLHKKLEKIKQIQKNCEKMKDSIQTLTIKSITNHGENQGINSTLKSIVSEYKANSDLLNSLKINVAIEKEKIDLFLRSSIPIPTISALSSYKQEKMITFFINKIWIMEDEDSLDIVFNFPASKEAV